jgi:hypothetical protein
MAFKSREAFVPPPWLGEEDSPQSQYSKSTKRGDQLVLATLWRRACHTLTFIHEHHASHLLFFLDLCIKFTIVRKSQDLMNNLWRTLARKARLQIPIFNFAELLFWVEISTPSL